MDDTVRYIADTTRLGRFIWRWEVIEKHYFPHGSSFTVLDSGVTWTRASAHRASKRAVRRRKNALKWDIFSNVQELT